MLAVVFKRYQEIGADHKKNLGQLATQRADRYIEKDVFQTLQTLESRNVTQRQQDLQNELRAEQERERNLQERY